MLKTYPYVALPRPTNTVISLAGLRYPYINVNPTSGVVGFHQKAVSMTVRIGVVVMFTCWSGFMSGSLVDLE